MKFLLTSAGVTNASIHDALVDLLGKPIDECTALCIPTAQYGHPHVGPGVKPWGFVSGREESQMTQLGWKSVGLLELTALPTIDDERWGTAGARDRRSGSHRDQLLGRLPMNRDRRKRPSSTALSCIRRSCWRLSYSGSP